MTRALILGTAIIIAGGFVAAAIALSGPRLAPTSSGVVDRTNRTDRLKTPTLEISVASECRSA